MPARFKFIATFFIIVTWILISLSPIGVKPAYAASLVVTGGADTVATDDICTLREAILNAHSDNQSGSTDCAPGSGPDTITFDGDYTITLGAQPLPDLYYNLSIDASGHSVTLDGRSAFRLFNVMAGAVVTITHLSIFDGDAQTGNGGGITNAGTLTVNNSTFSANKATTGGGIYNSSGSTLTVNNSSFSGNSTTSRGGGIANDGNLTVVNSILSSNSAASGAGLYNGGTLAVSNTTFNGNSASGTAITDGGGGIYTWSPATITNSTFSGNSAYQGAGIYNVFDSVTIINSTFGNNSASMSGGGIYNDGTATVIHSTFSGNYAYAVGAGVYNAVVRTMHLRNSLIANSSIWGLPGRGDCENKGTLATNVNNLIESGTCSPAVSGDPLLGPLTNNGGSTQTFALLPGSPAIDAAGDCTPYLNPDEDQRGVARPQGASCDIGAYEVKEQLGPNLVVNVADDSDDGSCDVFGPSDCTLREALNAANILAGANTITFASNYTIGLSSGLPVLTGELTIDGSGHNITVSGNPAAGVFVVQSGAVVTMNRLNIINGHAYYGGGVYNDGTLAVNNSIISGNSAQATGGGIYNNGPLTISNSTISGNTATGGSGIINFSTLSINQSTLSGNSASTQGGGIYNSNGSTLSINNSTFGSNSAQIGGGILNFATLTINSSTFSGNSASAGGAWGGGIENYTGATLHLRNSLIANSSVGADCGNSGAIATNINNLIEDSSCSPTLSGEPLLSSLGDYGGSTQTFALLPGSKAIDAAGDCTPFLNPDQDQRGVVRPQGSACDIGAFESQRFVLTKTGGDNQSTLVQTAFTVPLAISVTSATGEPVNGGRVIFASPTSGASLATTPITLTIAAGAVSSTVAANGTAGSYVVVASASGAANVAFDLTNDPFGTTTSITSTPNPSVYGQAVMFTATVTSTVGTPSGSVQFYADGSALGSPVALSNGQASLSTSALAVGTHPITATYSGDTNHNGSTSNTIDHVVNPADTTTTIASALNPSIVGQAVTFTVAVTATIGTPTGSVQFYADGSALGSPVALSNGQASLSTSALAVGTHPITATYSGDTNHNGSTSNQIDQIVTDFTVYLPLISHNSVAAPDLITQTLTADANNLQVVIKNQGTAPVVDESGVNVYLNPMWVMLRRIRG
jgi:CSLREA domain-containing protein